LLNSIGEAKVLVLPIDFPNDAGTATELQQLQKTFFGTSDQVEYESVKSYYAKSSFGVMNLTGSVMPWYRAEQNFQYYANLYDNYNQDSDQSLIKDALNYHITNNGLNLDDYDLNDDGYVDSIWAIYSAPIDYTGNSIIWWAYQYNFMDLSTIDGKRLDLYAWASVDFMKEDREQTNARTYIHETGHLLGLDDYYDYDETVGAKGGLGGADMMDYNAGDHNSFSKMLLGWVNPYLINGDTVTVDLQSCSDTGEVILIPVKWEQSIFTEYYLVEFYTPTSLNSDNTYLTAPGIRILHVIASIGPLGASGEYETIYNYDNTDTNYKLITMSRASGALPFGEGEYASNADLFKAGATKSFKAYNQTELFTISVNAFSSSAANITITLAE
jgi:M6 family metalloprotease-like protein